MILYITGFGMTIYHFLYPGPENWGGVTVFYVGIPSLFLLLADLVMREKYLDKKLWLVQTVIAILLLIIC